MKKKLVIAIGAIVGASVLGFGLIHSSSSQLEPSLTAGQIKSLVSEQYPGQVAEPTLKTDANRPVYEIKVSSDDRAYEIKLDGHSGDVLNITEKPIENPPLTKEDSPKDNQKKQAQQKKNRKQAGQKKTEKQTNDIKETKTVISPEEAGKIALNQFSGTIDEIELDEEDGRLIYEVEIERSDQEAEIEIDAYTGEVIVIEIEED